MRQGERQLRVIRLLLIWQLLGIVICTVTGSFWSGSAAIGAASGGLIAWVPNCYFAFRAFRYRGAQAARKIVSSFFSGLAGKLLMTGALFTVAFVKLNPLNAPALFAGFVFVQMFSWLVPLVVGRKPAFGAS